MKGGTEECDICMEPKELCEMKPCNHKICNTCFNLMNEPKKCPMCRANVDSLVCNGAIMWRREQTISYDTLITEVMRILGDNWEVYDNDNLDSLEIVKFKYKNRGRAPPYMTNLKNFLSANKLKEGDDVYPLTQDSYMVGGIGQVVIIRVDTMRMRRR